MRQVSGITASSDELKRLIAEHPDYKICVLMAEDSTSYDYYWTYASDISFGIHEILTKEPPYEEEGYLCTDRDNFYERLEDWLWGEMCDEINKNGMYDDREPSDDDYQKRLDELVAEYEPYWETCIAIYAGR